MFAGAFQQGINPFIEPFRIFQGLPFAITLMSILLCHEMGHFIASKAHGVAVSPPLFIPAPTLLGTFGAFIKMKEMPPSRAAIIDIGAMGPIAGFIVAVPVWIWGVLHSEFAPVASYVNHASGFSLGSSIIVYVTQKTLIGQSGTIYLHPVGFAAWIGFFVTCLNLIPIGQLDGGHILYGVLGKKAHRISLLFWTMLLLFGLSWNGWLVWAILLSFLGIRHPRNALVETTPLDSKRKALALTVLAIFTLTFIPAPF